MKGAYWCYVLRSEKDGRHYVGHTRDLSDRPKRHKEGRVRSTKGQGPWVLVHSERFNTRGEAIQRERAIKAKRKKTFLKQLTEQKAV